MFKGGGRPSARRADMIAKTWQMWSASRAPLCLHGPTVRQTLILRQFSNQVQTYLHSTPWFQVQTPSPHLNQSNVTFRWQRRGISEWYNHSQTGVVLPPFLLSQGQFAQKLVA